MHPAAVGTGAEWVRISTDAVRAKLHGLPPKTLGVSVSYAEELWQHMDSSRDNIREIPDKNAASMTREKPKSGVPQTALTSGSTSVAKANQT